jgi:hypothetical protein
MEEFITDGTVKWLNDEIKNKYIDNLFRIPLRNKYKIIVEYSIVDEDDYDKVMKHKWHLTNGGYARGKIKDKMLFLHHFVFKKPKNKYVIDHLNGDKLDNQNNNIDEVSSSVNNQNKPKKKGNHTSIYKGVSCIKNKNNTITYQVRYSGKQLGSFDKEIEAAKFYDIYVYNNIGENASTNNLISYEEAIKNYIEPTKVIRKIPLNIIKKNNSYLAEKKYNGKVYTSKYVKTIEEAIKNLEKINIEINKKKIIDELQIFQNRYNINYTKNIAIIKTFNDELIIDKDLFIKVNKYKWTKNNSGYFQNEKKGLIHRFISDQKKSSILYVDHINHNKNDNRELNLRPVNSSINNHNKSKADDTSSKFIGVYYCNNKWRACITKDNKKYELGYYDTEEEAARVRDAKAIELYKENATLNSYND